MLRTPVALLAALVLAPTAHAAEVLELGDDGRVRARADHLLPPPDPRPPAHTRTAGRRPRAAAARRTVRRELARLRDAGAIDAARHDAWRATYDDALALRRRLRGARRAELASVIAMVEGLAARGRLTAGRAPLLLLTLERNRRWWQAGPLLGWGRRVAFEGSALVWQAYPGRGLQLQWLGTFGKANGLFLAGGRDEELRSLLDEALALAVPRARGLGFEHVFAHEGGAAPWVSGITQGTAVQALSRAAVRLGEPRLFTAARAALAPLAARPPRGVNLHGHLLMYSQAPRLRILNGFVQALNGILDFAKYANDEPARALFAASEARLRRELPSYDTGAWSLYRPGKEADLGYHVLQRDFLRGLCRRLQERPLADPAPYCAAAERFTAYTRTPPRIRVVRGTLRRRRPGAIRVDLDKVSVVTLVVRREGRVVLRRRARLERGRRSFPLTPRSARPLAVTVRAVDLAGNAAQATATLRVRR